MGRSGHHKLLKRGVCSRLHEKASQVPYVTKNANHYCSTSTKPMTSSTAKSSVQGCANAVNFDSECGTVFYSNGVGICDCVRKGDLCGATTSTAGDSVYEIQASQVPYVTK